eukprot:CAMPEP_0113568800 /NCGR_PEP_ID=MMETSP0015_2-20120614/24052_1 /TAXON_ID=2838 /ORGANISM="Odontella" /LENGTH=526 /DNA_ID=CAMNT_0000471385 /DNA_START=15 /DNA_END=1595 /DNA_ORIENTATION=+ /assembly_acc=CAM_ASM_000160
MSSFPFRPLYTQTGSIPSPEEEVSLEHYALLLTIAFTVVVYALEATLDFRQRGAYQGSDFPRELEDTVRRLDEEAAKDAKEAKEKEGDEQKGETTSEEKEELDKKDDSKKDGEGDDEEDDKTKSRVDHHKPLLPQLQTKFQSAQSYGQDKINFSIFSNVYHLLEALAFLLVGFSPYMWDKSVEYGTAFFGWDEETDEIKVTLIFLLLTTLVSTVMGLPFEVYQTFYIEKKHGFSKVTVKLFITDKIKSLLLSIAIGGPFVALLLQIIKWGGDHFYLYVWAFVFVFSVAMMTIIPVYIMPLFNKYEPLKEGDLKQGIFALADRVKYPLTKLFVVDGSKRSSHSNAYMFGFGKNKRIVLYDTLLKGDGKVRDDEVIAILGHELGHWKLKHTLINFVVSQLYFGAAFYGFSLSYGSDNLYAAFGFDGLRDGRIVPTIVALTIFFETLWAPVDKVLSFLLTYESRIFEFQADKFSVDLGMSARLQSGLAKIHLENLGAMCSDPWYSAYHYSHPPLVERLAAMMELDKKAK